MPSDFEFLGVYNNQANFRERSSGTASALPPPQPETAPVELLEGDEVVIPTQHGAPVWSIRERRIVRHNR